MMQKEHREAHDQIRALASAQNITLVDTLTEDQKKDLEQLKGKKGPAFDLDFMWFVVKDHRAETGCVNARSKPFFVRFMF